MEGLEINHKKGNNLGWFFGGKHYDFFATMLGFGKSYYKQVVSVLPLEKGMSILDGMWDRISGNCSFRTS